MQHLGSAAVMPFNALHLKIISEIKMTGVTTSSSPNAPQTDTTKIASDISVNKFFYIVLTVIKSYLAREPKATDLRFASELVSQFRGINRGAHKIFEEESIPPVFPIIPGIENSALSPRDFFNGPGLILKKLYRILDSDSKNIMRNMMSYTPEETIRDIFSDLKFPNLSKKSHLTTQTNSIKIGDYQGESRIIQSSENLNRAPLAWHQLTSKDDEDNTIFLLGILDVNQSEIFTGLACVKLEETLHIVPVKNKALQPNENFDLTYFLKDNTGTQISGYNSIYRRHIFPDITFSSDVTFDPEHAIKPGLGKRIFLNIKCGKKIEFLSLFNKEGIIENGTKGTKIEIGIKEDEANPEGRRMEWRDVTFINDGKIKDGSRGTRIDTQPDGTTKEHKDVTFEDDGYKII